MLTPRERTVRSDRRLGAITLLLRLPQVMAPLGLLTLVAVSSSSAWTAALSSASLCLGIAVSGVGVAALANARIAYAAFEDYRLGGAVLSAKGVEVLKRRLAGEAVTQESSGMSKGEWREFEGVWG